MVTLREIDVNNFWDVISLTVAEDQTDLVLENAVSIAQSKVQPECIPLAVYVDETPVGFVMYCIDRDDGEYWLYRLMIDKAHQGKGHGRAALDLVLDRIRTDKIHNKILLGVDLAGVASVNLYKSLGFVSNGQTVGKEHIMELAY
jgi:diamine N-acetyltransferase